MGTFKGKISVVSDYTLTSAIDLGIADYKVKTTTDHNFTNGEAANQAEQVFTDSRTITASSNEDLDLAGGLTNVFGTTLTFTSIKGIIIKASSANTNNVVLGGAATNAFATFLGDTSDTIVVKPGGSLAIVAPDASGYAITAGTADLLRVANSSGGTSVTYEITLIGTE